MSYIFCNYKKKGQKVHMSVCERCKGMQCPDYRNYVQMSLFPSFIEENSKERKPFALKGNQTKKETRDRDKDSGQMVLFEA